MRNARSSFLNGFAQNKPVPVGRSLVCLSLLTGFISVGTPSAWADEPGARENANVCATVWFTHGARVQMEADGSMPLSRRTVLQPPLPTDAGCQADIEIHSKTALAALMGPPVVTEQQQRVLLRPATNGAPPSITGEATVNAWGKYARLYGTTSIDGLGLLDNQYRGLPLREGDVIPGESVDASASFTIYARESGDEVGKLVAPHATVSVASRRVGKRQVIRTALGLSECVPIEYVRTTSLGPMVIAGEQIVTKATQMQVTDWYCPAQAIVMRQDISEEGKVQHIQTTVVESLQ
ncbi:hypothetical protein LMG23994_04965 [Cupriavidus pinatubonensis]|uniref:Uncharacterized protein n=3 Tax=Cupriavidus pinatubonensis TaxID=248026 RepID=A0ABN7ZEE0_9BURK|nr:hypothetical protein LMG23994_04965 [Cupriavidus pinatubonensis]